MRKCRLWCYPSTHLGTDIVGVVSSSPNPNRAALDAGAPFDLLKSLTCLDLLGIHVTSDWIHSTALRVPIELGGRTILIELSQHESAERTELTTQVLAGNAPETPSERHALSRHLEHLLGVGDQPEAFYELARADTDFWRTTQTLHGLHRVGFGTPFEGICWTILRQRQYPNVALARLRRLRQRFGTPVTHEGEEHHAFPAASILAGAPLESIRKEVKSRKKARYLREAAVAFAAMNEDLDVLLDDPAELEDRLVAIRGVGPWSARTFLATAFCRPHLDHAVVNGEVTRYWRDVLERFYGPDVNAAMVRERADHYGRWESYWLFYARFTHRAMKRAARAEIVEA